MRRLVPLFAFAVVTGFSLPAGAHSITIQVNRTEVAPGGKLTVYLGWGHALPVDELVDAETVTGFKVLTPSGQTESLETDARSLQANELTVEEEGVYQFSIERKPSVFTMTKGPDGETKFHRVGKDEVKLGPGESIERSARSRMFAKAIVVAGSGTSVASIKLGHDLEIVPVDGPANFVIDQPSRLLVLFRGKPLPYAKFYATSVRANPDGFPTTTATTDAEGIVEFTPEESGTWVLGANHDVPAAGDDARHFDHESYGATLTIGVLAESDAVE